MGMVLDLRNVTVRRYHDVAGTVAEGYFGRFAGVVARGPLGMVFDLERVQRDFLTLGDMLRDTGLRGVAETGEECVASFALLAALPSLDVNVGQSGLTVTNVGSMAPASSARVERLVGSVQTRAYAALSHLYESIWGAYAGLGPRVQGCLRRHPWRDGLCNGPYGWRDAAGAYGVGVSHFFTHHGVLQLAEEEMALPLLGPHFYTEMVHVANGPKPEGLPQSVVALRMAVHLEAAARVTGGGAAKGIAARRLRMARSLLEEERDMHPLWADSPYDSGVRAPYGARHGREGLFWSGGGMRGGVDEPRGAGRGAARWATNHPTHARGSTQSPAPPQAPRGAPRMGGAEALAGERGGRGSGMGIARFPGGRVGMVRLAEADGAGIAEGAGVRIGGGDGGGGCQHAGGLGGSSRSYR